MKKTGLIIGLAAAVVLFLVMNGFGGGGSFIQENWELEIPKGDTEVYNFGTETARYYAVIYDEPEEAEGAFTWQTEEGETLESGSYSEAIEAWMEEAEVPTTLPIDIEAGPYYYLSKEDGSELIVVLDNKMLHFLEHVK